MLRLTSKVLSNRYTHSKFMQCLSCAHVQRFWHGYKPISDPIFFEGKNACKDFHEEQINYVTARADSLLCDNCGKLHDGWNQLSFQQVMDIKEKQPSKKSMER